MLVLTRKLHESIQIGDEITIEFLSVDIRHNTIKLGICAPSGVKIMRTEVLARAGTDFLVPDRGAENARDH